MVALIVIDAQQEYFAPAGKIVLPGGPPAVERITLGGALFAVVILTAAVFVPLELSAAWGELYVRTLGRLGFPSDTTRDPTDLVALTSAIHRHLEGGNAAVVLEGLEYLVSLNGFSSVLRFVQTLNEKVVLNDSVLLITANADAMKEQEYRLLAKEMTGEL